MVDLFRSKDPKTKFLKIAGRILRLFDFDLRTAIAPVGVNTQQSLTTQQDLSVVQDRGLKNTTTSIGLNKEDIVELRLGGTPKQQLNINAPPHLITDNSIGNSVGYTDRPIAVRVSSSESDLIIPNSNFIPTADVENIIPDSTQSDIVEETAFSQRRLFIKDELIELREEDIYIPEEVDQKNSVIPVEIISGYVDVETDIIEETASSKNKIIELREEDIYIPKEIDRELVMNAPLHLIVDDSIGNSANYTDRQIAVRVNSSESDLIIPSSNFISIAGSNESQFGIVEETASSQSDISDDSVKENDIITVTPRLRRASTEVIDIAALLKSNSYIITPIANSFGPGIISSTSSFASNIISAFKDVSVGKIDIESQLMSAPVVLPTTSLSPAVIAFVPIGAALNVLLKEGCKESYGCAISFGVEVAFSGINLLASLLLTKFISPIAVTMSVVTFGIAIGYAGLKEDIKIELADMMNLETAISEYGYKIESDTINIDHDQFDDVSKEIKFTAQIQTPGLRGGMVKLDSIAEDSLGDNAMPRLRGSIMPKNSGMYNDLDELPNFNVDFETNKYLIPFTTEEPYLANDYAYTTMSMFSNLSYFNITLTNFGNGNYYDDPYAHFGANNDSVPLIEVVSMFSMDMHSF